MENHIEKIGHKGYKGTVEFDVDTNCYFGKIIGIIDLVNYEGQSIDILKDAFREAVDDYLLTCDELRK